jgi:hypothetical protein
MDQDLTKNKEYLEKLRNLVKEFVSDYEDYDKANEFILNYSFGKTSRSPKIIDLENEYMKTCRSIMSSNSLQQEKYNS